MSKAKGKRPVKPAAANSALPPLPNPSAGSANPSASFSALWGYIQPALDHIVRSPTNNMSKAPSIDLVYYASIHSHTYNYFTTQSETVNSVPRGTPANNAPVSGTDLYEHLDRYYADTARELYLGSPPDSSTLIHYLLPCFNRYTAGAQSVNRLLNYVNRHYVKRAVDEYKGWLTLDADDLLETVTKSPLDDQHEKISKKWKEKRTSELVKWGYVVGGSSESAAQAEACAEAASPLDRIVPIASVAHRRFRTEFIEPLLAVPKVQGKSKRPKKPNGSAPPGPKGRLARAVKELLESTDGDEEEKRRLATELAITLRSVGVRPDHPLRKTLDKFVVSLA